MVERGFPGFLTDSDNPGIYANLAFYLRRDNVRQSSADLLGLRAALAFANRKAAATIGVGKDLKVSFVGHSLGGIVGTNFVAIANEISDYVGIDNSMFKIDETILAMAGSMIAHIMLESAEFGPIVKHDVAVSGSPTLSAAFEQFKPLCEDSSEKPVLLLNLYLHYQQKIRRNSIQLLHSLLSQRKQYWMQLTQLE